MTQKSLKLKYSYQAAISTLYKTYHWIVFPRAKQPCDCVALLAMFCAFRCSTGAGCIFVVSGQEESLRCLFQLLTGEIEPFQQNRIYWNSTWFGITIRSQRTAGQNFVRDKWLRKIIWKRWMKTHLGWYYVKWQKGNDWSNGEFVIDLSDNKSQLSCCSTQPLFREVFYWGKNIQHLQREIDFFQLVQSDLER